MTDHDSPTGEVQQFGEAPVTRVRWFGIVVLVGHLGLLAVGAISLWRIPGGGVLGGIVAALFVVGYAVLWRFLLAPGSHRRLGYRERLTTALILGPIVLLLAALVNLWLQALIALSVVLLGDSLNESRR